MLLLHFLHVLCGVFVSMEFGLYFVNMYLAYPEVHFNKIFFTLISNICILWILCTAIFKSIVSWSIIALENEKEKLSFSLAEGIIPLQFFEKFQKAYEGLCM